MMTIARASTLAVATIAAVLVAALAAGPAFAEAPRRHVVTTGQTLYGIARRYQCSVAELQRANKIEGSLIRPGQRIAVPSCEVRGRRAVRTATAEPAAERVAAITIVRGQSIGKPWAGSLSKGVQLRASDGIHLRRPHRTWGASHVVGHVERALAETRQKVPSAHTLAIGDLSVARGGAITEHHSHQSGRDIDIGLYYTRVPRNYPDEFVVATAANLDVAATWALLFAFARTADQPTGVSAIFLDFDTQGLLYDYALAHEVPQGYLDRLFQYPHGRGAAVGLIRHEPHHADHLHIRFKCAPRDGACR